MSIIELAEKQLGLGDLEIEVEYQGSDTIAKYSLVAGENGTLLLTSKHTDCLAKSDCGIPVPKPSLFPWPVLLLRKRAVHRVVGVVSAL